MVDRDRPADAAAPRHPQEPVAPAHTPINRPVLIGAGLGIVGITAWAFVDQDGADRVIGEAVTWVAREMGWFYILLVTSVLVFVLWAALSKVGNVKLGPDHSKPVFGIFAWTAMLFAAGIGIDLMFFSVAEPVTQYLEPPQGEGATNDAARQALVWTMFHYGITGWALYALMGLALGYFAYRHNLPLSIRSALHPIFGRRINGLLGDGVDVAALLGAVFGLATSLGIGVAQLNFGLHQMFDLPEGTTVQAALIALAVLIAIISAVSGIDRGVRVLSQVNIVLAIGLMVYILVAGRTTFLLDGLVQNVGDVLSRFPGMTMDTMAYDRPDAWMQDWTLFFWAWWIAWAPFVGLFLARISRGRTIRQFVLGTLTVPFAFIAIWISIFGNSALAVVRNDGEEFGEVAVSAPEQAFYTLLEQYPGAPLLAAVATFTGLLFYVTSADSGALVMANFTSRLPDNESDGSGRVRIFWAITTGLLTLAMLMIGGVSTLQSATVIMGLPFAFVVLFLMLGLFKALQVERHWAETARSAVPAALLGRANGGAATGWRQRLRRAVVLPDAAAADRYATTVVREALEEMAAELAEQGQPAVVGEQVVDPFGIHAYHLDVPFADQRGFHYQVYPTRHRVPAYGGGAQLRSHYYRLEVFRAEGSTGADLYGCTKAQVIDNVLDHYERHLQFLRLAGEGTAVEGEAVLDWSHDFELDGDVEPVPTTKEDR